MQLLGPAPYWVVDVRRRDALDAATTRWLTATFLPLLPARLAGPVYLAYLERFSG